MTPHGRRLLLKWLWGLSAPLCVVLVLHVLVNGTPNLEGTVSLVVLPATVVGTPALLVLNFWMLWEYTQALRYVSSREWHGRREGSDPAYRGYFGAPALVDRTVAPSFIVDRTGTLGGIAAAGFVVIHGGVVVTCVVGAFVARVVLGGAHAVARVWRGHRVVCPFCWEWVSRPTHVCVRCGRRHTQLRPGRYGVLRRACECAAWLPTMPALRMSHQAREACPSCDRLLEHRPGITRELVLPLFGSAGAGKTRLMLGLTSMLEAAGGERVEFADLRTRTHMRSLATPLWPENRVPPTGSDREPEGLLFRLTTGGRSLLLQLFDVSGARFDHSEDTEALTYLGKAHTFVLVVDPLGSERVWRSLSSEERERLAPHRSAARDPELAYQQTYEQVERLGGEPTKARLAIVVSRGDLLEGTSLAPPPDATVEQWGRDILGFGNLVRSAKANFAEYAVFLVAAVERPDGTPVPSVAALARWLLRDESRDFATAVERVGAPPPARCHRDEDQTVEGV